jgi:hypothetical protein
MLLKDSKFKQVAFDIEKGQHRELSNELGELFSSQQFGAPKFDLS